MNILIVGPGAIGCLLAGMLKENGHNVHLLDKDPERAKLLNRRGIKIKNRKTRTIRVPVLTESAEVYPPRFVFICVKSFDTEAAIESAIAAVGPETYVVSFQNGIGNAEVIAQYTGKSRVICAVTSQGSTSLGPGHVRHAGEGTTFVAPFDSGKNDAAHELAGLLGGAGIATSFRKDLLPMLWGKLIINAAINPVTAASGVPNGALLKSEKLEEVMRAAAREAQQVAQAKKIRLDYVDAPEEAANVCRATAKNISSMLQDVRNGRQTEIESITGSIISEAQKLGIDVPTNEALMDMIEKLEIGKSKLDSGHKI